MAFDTAAYRSMETLFDMDRRRFIRAGSCAGAALLLGVPPLWSDGKKEAKMPDRIKTNIADALAVKRSTHALPGAFPGRVVEVADPKVIHHNKVTNARRVGTMVKEGIEHLTGENLKKSFARFFNPDDIVGIKVNPVGGKVISTHVEVVDAVISWLVKGGVKRGNIVIWDRFDYMLKDAGFTPERFPGIRLEGLQTMDEAAAEGKAKDDSRWLDKSGKHVSEGNFDRKVYYWADVEGAKDKPYLNQHVVNGKYSYFGKLVSQRLTKIINIPVFKNTGNGVSMATKNLAYGSICNTGRLHRPLFFYVCTEVLAFPPLRDKVVLNILDGLVGQYEGGPMPAPKFTYPCKRLFFATDPFALDRVGHTIMVAKRKAMGIKVNEHPIYSDYLNYAEKIGLGITNPRKISLIKI